MPHNHRAVLAHCIDLIRMFLKNNPQRIGSFHSMHRFGNRLQRIPLVITVQQMRHHLRIRLRYKLIPLFFQILPQLHIILNNSIMNQNNFSGTMRMSIYIGNAAMSCPASMANTTMRRTRDLLFTITFKIFDLTNLFYQTNFRIFHAKSNTCTVISSVFQTG